MLTERITERKARGPQRVVAYEIDPNTHLTPTELSVAQLLAVGSKNAEIAAELKCCVKTIDTHRQHVLRKTACRNNVELARWALRRDLVSL